MKLCQTLLLSVVVKSELPFTPIPVVTKSPHTNKVTTAV